MKDLALFDFDGTITYKDSFFQFIKFSKGSLKTYIGLFFLFPIILLYKLKILPNYKAKEIVISWFFKNMQKEVFEELAREFSLNHIDKIIRTKALEEINWHKNQGNDVVIVSASIEEWLKPWCNKYNIDLIGTKLEYKNDRLTGKLSTKNCYGVEKVERLTKFYNKKEYNFIYAYGDSEGDKELLAFANKSFYKPFKEKL
ncbi:HAD family hydrolase [Campylobacterota bacterium DY0563]